jgi:hypothetical protein
MAEETTDGMECLRTNRTTEACSPRRTLPGFHHALRPAPIGPRHVLHLCLGVHWRNDGPRVDRPRSPSKIRPAQRAIAATFAREAEGYLERQPPVSLYQLGINSLLTRAVEAQCDASHSC